MLVRSPILAEMCKMFILSMFILSSVNQNKLVSIDSRSSPPDVNGFYGETCFIHSQTKHVLA